MPSFDIVEKLKQEIAAAPADPALEEVGTVFESGDGIVRISGLRAAMSQEVLLIETAHGTVRAVAANLEDASVSAIIVGATESVSVGDRVHRTRSVLSIPVGDDLVGRVVSVLGEPLDDRGPVFQDSKTAPHAPLEHRAPGVLDRASVDTPLHTGIAAIDAMIPIGRGQRELIIGDRQTGKTSIALDTILNQEHDASRDDRPICVYVAVGQKNANIARVVKRLRDTGAMRYTIVVSAPAGAPAAKRYLAPYAGCAIGEYFMQSGKDALVVYDDLSKHADAYRELSLLLRRPPGREAYPGDIFYLHSRLLERAAKLNEENGGGSLTALPIIETKLGDVSAYVPTNVISITDGQIYLEADLFNRGIRPAINIGLSVSRVGSSAQTKAMKKVAGTVRLDLAQFRELQAFVQFASDLDESTRQKITRGERLTELLKQPDGAPIPFEDEVIMLYAAAHGFLEDCTPADVASFTEDMRTFIRTAHEEDIRTPLRESGVLDETLAETLTAALEEFCRTRHT